VREDVERIATPELSAAEPRMTPFPRKETVPVAVPDAAATFAVKVAGWPTVVVVGEALSEVVVCAAGPALTVSEMVFETLGT
jgi:hypothetical protein